MRFPWDLANAVVGFFRDLSQFNNHIMNTLFIIYLISVILWLLIAPCFKKDWKPGTNDKSLQWYRKWNLIIAFCPVVNSLLLVVTIIIGLFIVIKNLKVKGKT